MSLSQGPSAFVSSRWSKEQEARLLSRMSEGATINEVAGELGKSSVNVQMKWSIIRPVVVADAVAEPVVAVPVVAVPVTAVTAVPVDYTAQIKVIKDAVAALEAILAAK
jgi:hypothetical protein